MNKKCENEMCPISYGWKNNLEKMYDSENILCYVRGGLIRVRSLVDRCCRCLVDNIG